MRHRSALTLIQDHHDQVTDILTAAHADCSGYVALPPRSLAKALADYTSAARGKELWTRMDRAARLMGWRVMG